MIETLGIPRVGYLESQYLIPVIGNDVFSGGKGVLATSLEVYYHAPKSLYLIQQRSPVKAGKGSQFSNDICEWILQAGFKEVIYLHSLDAGQRFIDQQFSGIQLRYIKTDNFDDQLIEKELKWPKMESGSNLVEAIPPGTLSHSFVAASKKVGLPLLVLILFCFEGNNIPEGSQMAETLNQLLHIKPPEKPWQAPPSWQMLFSEGQYDQNLFL
eukprot:TRINITY_DN12492_c0_g1_i2.p1 TRINITY_DN12492_c0_g1~~TRINITY_DN12492_c0_g1_i2.p1  ORF type:complete len:213 (-),score=53.04 TRINITY_DN12492_c0_g1_i2:48-686(-)